MGTFISPSGNPEVWEKKPNGYFTEMEWAVRAAPEIPPDDRTPAQKRQDAYMMEVDPLRKQAAEYADEAYGLALLGDMEASEEAQSKADDLLMQAMLVKNAVRTILSDEALAKGATPLEEAMASIVSSAAEAFAVKKAELSSDISEIATGDVKTVKGGI